MTWTEPASPVLPCSAVVRKPTQDDTAAGGQAATGVEHAHVECHDPAIARTVGRADDLAPVSWIVRLSAVIPIEPALPVLVTALEARTALI